MAKKVNNEIYFPNYSNSQDECQSKGEQDIKDNMFILDDEPFILGGTYPSEFREIPHHKILMLDPISSDLSREFKQKDIELKKKHSNNPILYFEEYEKLEDEFYQYFKDMRLSNNGQVVKSTDPLSFVIHGAKPSKNIINKTEIVHKIKQQKCNDFHMPHLKALMFMGSNGKVKISELKELTAQLLSKLDAKYGTKDIGMLKYKTKRDNIINSGHSFNQILKEIEFENKILSEKMVFLPGEEKIITSNPPSIDELKRIRGHRSCYNHYYTFGKILEENRIQPKPSVKKAKAQQEEINKWRAKIKDLTEDFKKEVLCT